MEMTILKKDGKVLNHPLVNGKPAPTMQKPVEGTEFSIRRNLYRRTRNLLITALVFTLGSAVISVGLKAWKEANRPAVATVNYDPCKGIASYPTPEGNSICAPFGSHLGAGVKSNWIVKDDK